MKEKRDDLARAPEEPERDKMSRNSRAALPRASVNGTKKKGIVEAGARGRATRGASNLESMSE